MRAFLLVAGAALTLSACGGGGESEANELAVENLTVENLVVNDPAAMDANMSANLDANVTMNSDTANAVANDLTTNTPDANLANGM